jgi:transcriptional regulator with XRE-family HTH domain
MKVDPVVQRREFAERLIRAMQAQGLAPKASVLERGFNLHHAGKPMSLHGVMRWLKGQTMPTPDKLATLARWLKVDAQMLRDGTIGSVKAREPDAGWSGVVGWSDRELMEALSHLPATQRKVLREVIQAFVTAHFAQRRSTSTGP